MGAIKVLCPDCGELVESPEPCPLCGYTHKADLNMFIALMLVGPAMRGGSADVDSVMDILTIIMLFTGIGNLLARFLEVFLVERLTKRQQALQERLWGPGFA